MSRSSKIAPAHNGLCAMPPTPRVGMEWAAQRGRLAAERSGGGGREEAEGAREGETTERTLDARLCALLRPQRLRVCCVIGRTHLTYPPLLLCMLVSVLWRGRRDSGPSIGSSLEAGPRFEGKSEAHRSRPGTQNIFEPLLPRTGGL